MNKEQAVAEILDRTVGQIDLLPSATFEGRPGVKQISDELAALELTGGPADAVAFHDFHVLQMAFKHVWAQAFNQSIYENVEELYNETVRIYDDAGLPVPDFGAINDVKELNAFLGSAFGGGGVVVGPPTSTRSREGSPPIPPPPIPVPMSADLLAAFPEARWVWPYLTEPEKVVVQSNASIVNGGSTDEELRNARHAVSMIIEQAEAKLGRLSKLVLDIGQALSEPYAFDIFAPNTFNYGVMLTYRQRWEPLTYQAGDLVATIPLAPGEIRRYSRKQTIKKSIAQKEMERSMRSRSDQSSETGRAESEIMKKAASSTNFKMTSSGSFNVGIGSISASSEFGANQAEESASNKKNFHESTVKAAQEYRLERSLEIDTSLVTENEETSSGEISNPNNELTVTYLFYELQRRYQVSEQIHRARPVVLVAQDVPAPHEINEAWLISYQWILGRVLLDESIRPALQYLTSGFAGDEAAIQIIRAQWLATKGQVTKLERAVEIQLAQRDSLREMLVNTALAKSEQEAAALPTAVKVLFTAGTDPNDAAVDLLEAKRAAAETRLKYTEQAVEDAQRKLKQETDALEQATRQYADAMQKKFARHVAIDQLRLHVKQNILYYMQAIWDHEPTDQRFFRLYNKKIKFPTAPQGTLFSASAAPPDPFANMITTFAVGMQAPDFEVGDEVELVEVADIDNPIGYKGNYMIFPLKKSNDLTDFMLLEFMDEYFGIRDPDEAGAYTRSELEAWLTENLRRDDVTLSEKQRMERLFIEKLGEARPVTDEIIVPTGQLFIEALPGRHPLLEDFKLRHRIEDLHKVKSEVRHAELENLRLASRLVEGPENLGLLDDPDIEKKIVVGNGAAVVLDPDA
jgi:hypothetical protein